MRKLPLNSTLLRKLQISDRVTKLITSICNEFKAKLPLNLNSFWLHHLHFQHPPSFFRETYGKGNGAKIQRMLTVKETCFDALVTSVPALNGNIPGDKVARLSAEKWDTFICNCEEYEQDHVHCGCSSCNGAIVSRATAFRHLARESQSLPSCSAADSETSGELEPCPRETDSSVNNSMDWSSNGDHEGLSENDIPENWSDNLEETQTTPDDATDHIEFEVKEKIANAILDALELQLELKLSNIGFSHILEWGKKIFLMGHNEKFDHLWPTCWKEAESYYILLDTEMLKNILFALMRAIDAILAFCHQRMIFAPTVAKVVLLHSTILA